jgi:hypothetical protein
MTYQELKNQNKAFITYQDLLSCDEWLIRRKEILRRDQYYCHDCYASSSLFHDNFILYFKKNYWLNANRLVYSKIGLSQFKADFTTGEIKIYKHPELNFIYGLSSNYIVFALNQSILGAPKNELVVNHYPDNLSGGIIPVVDKPNGSDQPIPLPITRFSKRMIPLHVHHSYYIVDCLPWDYDDKALVTLCAECHKSFHEDNQVKVYTKKGDKLIDLNYSPCKRCSGSGYLEQYANVQGGICFRCQGARFEELIP